MEEMEKFWVYIEGGFVRFVVRLDKDCERKIVRVILRVWS